MDALFAHHDSDTGGDSSGGSAHSEHGAPGNKDKEQFWAKHKVEIIAALVGIAVTVYLYLKSKNSAATSPAASPTGLVTPSDTSGDGGGGSAGTDPGADTTPSAWQGGHGNQRQQPQPVVNNYYGDAGGTQATNGVLSVSAAESMLGITAHKATPVQAAAAFGAAVGSGNSNPQAAAQAALASETTIKTTKGVASPTRHAQEVANKPLRAVAKGK